MLFIRIQGTYNKLPLDVLLPRDEIVWQPLFLTGDNGNKLADM